MQRYNANLKSVFQSTPLSRGATENAARMSGWSKISIHAPLARGDTIFSKRSAVKTDFNPRPSREGRPVAGRRADHYRRFQSTPLSRGATDDVERGRNGGYISIHAPLARGDTGQYLYAMIAIVDFNPRPSREGRLKIPGRNGSGRYFNPRPSREGRRVYFGPADEEA